jgi:cell division transport system permease protein
LSIKLILQDNLSEPEYNALEKELSTKKYIKTDKSNRKEIEFIDKERAAIELQETLGENFIEHIGSNPLLPSIVVKFKAKYANEDSIQVIQEDLGQISGIKEVYYHENLIQAVNKNIRKITLVVLLFSGIILLIALALINNTIRLTIYSKRFIIRTMQLVGATAPYIRKPFLYRSMVQGMVGALFAAAVITGIVYFLQNQIQGTIPLNDTWTLIKVYVIIFVLGILLNGLSTYIAVTKYLKLETDKLYT